MAQDEQALLARFARTTESMVSSEEFQDLLRSGRQLRIKYGVDVTAPFLHIGHAVNLWMTRQLQDLGHKAVFLIGDFTTRIGDPTGRNKLRPVLSREEIADNMQRFLEQARMVLRFDDPRLLEIRYNSEWYDALSAQELLQLLAQVTHARLIGRDMFQERIRQGLDIHMHELIYPVLQGYDSVMLHSDLTIIGSDQLFNEMLGRFYQERQGQRPQVIITTRITPGIDGKAKQSKSLGNYIGLGHSPRDKFGRAMSIPDELILPYLEVYTDVSTEELRELAAQVAIEPMRCKLRLAYELVCRYHGGAVAEQEQQWFLETFSTRRTPDEMPVLTIEAGEYNALAVLQRFFAGSKSNRELRRLFTQGAVSLNGETLWVPEQPVSALNGAVFRVGKRTWFRVEEC
uniref:Tyrosine--tRNA ligase n=1 Tax=Thermosporothrix sp. COM3 TaxID=2490863 RepID=A0A455SXD8_9CHLR|nr:tyrosine--tRNA ligase [Thermosporothrix sp. COM3]